MRSSLFLLLAITGCATAQPPSARTAPVQYCLPCDLPCLSNAECGAKVAAAPAPAPVAAPAPVPEPAPAPAPEPVAKVDPCAPGQAHTPDQCPDLDDDGDGVRNADDKCPLVKGTKENNGCPPERAKIDVKSGKIEITEKVFFDSGKATIQKRSFKVLDDVAALLTANTDVGPVTVEGHTDNRGSAAVNRKLSRARAEAVKTYLVQKGVGAARLGAKGFGPDRPAQSNKTAAGRDANRRVEFVLAK